MYNHTNHIMKTMKMFSIILIMTAGCNYHKEDALPPVKEGMIAVEGGNIWYRMAGADKPGIPIIIVHGGPGVPHDYLVNLEALSFDRPVVFYDQLGCGNSDKPQDTSLWQVDRFVEELELLRKALKIETFNLLGQSWGGYLATSYFLKHGSGRVKSLILSAPLLNSARWSEDQRNWILQLPQDVQDTIEKYEANGDYASPSYQEAMMIFYSKHVCRLDPWPEAMNNAFQKMNAEVYNYMWGPSEFTLTGILKNADLTDRLHQINVPCLITCGEFDEATPASMAYFAGLIPGGELQVFQGASHAHHLEKEVEYLNRINTFLNQ